MRIKTLYKLAALYFGILYLLLITPFTVNLFNRIEPFILGLPFFQFIIICFVLLNSIGLFLLFSAEDRIEKNNRYRRGGNHQ